jgi:hypothetical protein
MSEPCVLRVAASLAPRIARMRLVRDLDQAFAFIELQLDSLIRSICTSGRNLQIENQTRGRWVPP